MSRAYASCQGARTRCRSWWLFEAAVGVAGIDQASTLALFLGPGDG